jgi:hypothetical protein
MPNLTQKKRWTEDELIVLCSIFATIGFSSGDDEKQENKLIAKTFGRSPGTVDMQWRNIKNYLANLPSKKTGALVKDSADRMMLDPKSLKLAAKSICISNGWEELLALIHD